MERPSEDIRLAVFCMTLIICGMMLALYGPFAGLAVIVTYLLGGVFALESDGRRS